MLPPSCLSALRSRPNERQVDPEMRGDPNNAIEATSEMPAGAGCQEKQNLPVKGNVFLLDIPFYRTRQGSGDVRRNGRGRVWKHPDLSGDPQDRDGRPVLHGL